MKRLLPVLFFMTFLVISCAPAQSQPTFMPLLVFGPTATATADVPTPTPLLSKTIQVSYAYALTSADTAELVVIAEFDLPGTEDILLPSSLDLEALKLVKGASPVFNLMIEVKEGTGTTSGYTDIEGRYSRTLSSSEGYTAFLPGWSCTEIATWELPTSDGSGVSRGGTLTCQKN